MENTELRPEYVVGDVVVVLYPSEPSYYKMETIISAYRWTDRDTWEYRVGEDNVRTVSEKEILYKL